MEKKSQITGNIGLYYVCCQLSRMGWNAMPTSRNTKGIDILAYNSDCSRTISLRVKTLSNKAPVPLGSSIARLLGDYWIIVNDVVNRPCVFVMSPEEVRKRAHRGEKDGGVSFWLQPKSYEVDDFRDKWDRLGRP